MYVCTLSISLSILGAASIILGVLLTGKLSAAEVSVENNVGFCDQTSTVACIILEFGSLFSGSSFIHPIGGRLYPIHSLDDRRHRLAEPRGRWVGH